MLSDDALQSYLNTDQTYCLSDEMHDRRVDVIRDLEDGFTIIPSELKRSFQKETKSNLFS